MTSLARMRRRVVPALVGAALVVAGGLAAATLDSLGNADAANPPRSTTTPVPQLTVTSAVIATDATVGSTVTYTTAVRNSGKLEIGASVADTLPDGVALIAADADQGGSCTGGMPRITCTWNTLSPKVTATAVFVVQVIAPGTLTNGIELTPSDPINTLVTTATAPPTVVAGEGVAVRFVPRATLTGK